MDVNLRSGASVTRRALQVTLCMAMLLAWVDSAAFNLELRNPCESPSMPAGRLHVVIAGFESKLCFTHYLWDLGLSNAHVFVYRRLNPEVPLRRWRGPCGMTVQEKLLLPNHGRELAAFTSYVSEFYDRPPSAVVFLHGHGPHGWHTDCEAIVGRTRLFYRSLVAAASPDEDVHEDAEFGRHMVALTRFGKSEDAPWIQDLVMDPLLARETRGQIARRLLEGSSEASEAARCEAFLAKWHVNTTSAGFHSNGATFILPWERILWYPKEFYRQYLQYAFSGDDTWTGRFCFEFSVYAMYQEPAINQVMQKLYWKASHLALQYNLSSCTTPWAGC